MIRGGLGSDEPATYKHYTAPNGMWWTRDKGWHKPATVSAVADQGSSPEVVPFDPGGRITSGYPKRDANGNINGWNGYISRRK
jgi:hypothetical protein